MQHACCYNLTIKLMIVLFITLSQLFCNVYLPSIANANTYFHMSKCNNWSWGILVTQEQQFLLWTRCIYCRLGWHSTSLSNTCTAYFSLLEIRKKYKETRWVEYDNIDKIISYLRCSNVSIVLLLCTMQDDNLAAV